MSAEPWRRAVMRRKRAALAVALAVVYGAAACSDEGAKGPTDAASVIDVSDPDAVQGDVAVDAGGHVGADTTSTGFGEDCPGGPGCPCKSNTDCADERCGDTPLGRICYPRCGGACPDGWRCHAFSRGADAINVCVPAWGLPCRPCTSSAGCRVPGVTDTWCAAYGQGYGQSLGGFCGLACDSDDACPAGQACEQVAVVDGAPRKLCVAPEATEPAGAACACSPAAKAVAATTPCHVLQSAPSGLQERCVGQRACGDGGLSACVALTGASASCEDAQCLGKTDGTPCAFDSDPCTPADVCKGDVCVNGDSVCPCAVDADCADDADLCNGVPYCAPQPDGTRTCAPNPASVVTCPTVDDTACSKRQCQPATGACPLVSVPDGSPCEDGKPCTKPDLCDAGACAPGPWTCGCKTDADCAKADDGDACNGVWFCNAALAQCQFNPATAVSCPTAFDTDCASSTCDPKTGACTMKPAKAGAPCDDGNPCTVGEACQGPSCTAPPSANKCDCVIDADCASKPNPNLCLGPLFCNAALSKCVHNPTKAVVCDIGKATACTTPACDSKTGACGPVALPNGATCDADGTLCTPNDTCQSGVCEADTNGCACTSDAECAGKEDGDVCNGTLYCDKKVGTCLVNPATVVSCPTASDQPCRKNRCQPKTGSCAMQDLPDGAGCDDGQVCSSADTCDKGLCTPGTSVCQCKVDADCAPLDDADKCNGTLYCAKDAQGLGACKLNPATMVTCPKSGAACKLAGCDPKTGTCGTQSAPDGGPCDDGDPCTEGDRCLAGTCTPLKPKDCAKGGPCVEPGTCSGGACVPGKAKICDDGDPCTKDSCDAAKGCVSSPDPFAKSCDDGSPCTTVDGCESGVCKGLAFKVCDDSDDCTGDSCDPKQGCVYQALTGAPCDDGESCTKGDSCKAGTCSTHTEVIPCDDGVACTASVCQGKVCTHVPTPKACDDKLSCTLDLCHPVAGCVHTPQPMTCDDGKACTKDVCDLSKGCVSTTIAWGDPCVTSCGAPGTCEAGSCKSDNTFGTFNGQLMQTGVDLHAKAMAGVDSGSALGLAHRVPNTGDSGATLLRFGSGSKPAWSVDFQPSGSAKGAGVPADLAMAPGDAVAVVVGTAAHVDGKTGDDVWFEVRAAANGTALGSVAWPIPGKQRGAAVARVPGDPRWLVAWDELEGSQRCRLAVVDSTGTWQGGAVALGAGKQGTCHGLEALPDGDVVVTGRHVSGSGQPWWGLVSASGFGPQLGGSWTLPTKDTKDAWAMDAAALQGGALAIGGLLTRTGGDREVAVWRVDRRGNTLWSATRFVPGGDAGPRVARVVALPDGGVQWAGMNVLGKGTQFAMVRFTGAGTLVEELLLDAVAGDAVGDLAWLDSGSLLAFNSRTFNGTALQWNRLALSGASGCGGAGLCIGQNPTECDDGNPCTRATCDPKAGCSFTLEVAPIPCDDGQACTGAGTCWLGICKPGTPHWGTQTGPAGVRVVAADSGVAGTWVLSRSVAGQVRLGQVSDDPSQLSAWPLPTTSKGSAPDVRAILARGAAAWVGGSVQVSGKGPQAWLGRLSATGSAVTLHSETLLGGTATRVVALANDLHRPRFAALVDRGVDTVSLDAFEPGGVQRWSATLSASPTALPRGVGLVAAPQGGYVATWRDSKTGSAGLGFVDAAGQLQWTRTESGAPSAALLARTPGPLWLTAAGSGATLTTSLRQARVGDGKAATAVVALSKLAPQGLVAAALEDGADLVVASVAATMTKGVATPTGALRVSRLARDGTLLATVLTSVTVSDPRLALARESDGDLVVLGTTTTNQQLTPFAYRLGADLSTTCSGEGQCKGKKPAACDDGKPCTWDGCDPAKGCVHIDVAKACDDGDACTTDTCNATKGCAHSPANQGKSCGGGAGICLEGHCRWAYAIGQGDDHTCAIQVTGGVSCWGEGKQGEVALDGSKVPKSPVPTAVPGVSGLTEIDGSHSTTVGRKANGSLVFWGQDQHGLSSLGGQWKAGQANPSGDWGANAEVAASAGGLCVRRSGGSVACSGDNSHWQATAGQSTSATAGRTEIQLPTGRTAVSLCRGRRHACVALDNGQVSCWGANDQGQVKGATAGSAKEKLHTFSLPKGSALKLGCSVDSSCAVASGGQTWCWGRNLGLTTSLLGGKVGEKPATITTPVSVAGLKDVAELVAAQRTFCARTDTKQGGEVWCFGDNTHGELGRLAPLRSATPLKVALPAPAVDLASVAGDAGERFCAVLQTGRVWCWGRAAGGELGDGRGATELALPFELPASRL